MVIAPPPSVGVHERMSRAIEVVRGDRMWVWHAIVTVVIAVVLCLQQGKTYMS